MEVARTVNDRDPTYTVYSRLARGPPGADGELLCHRIEQEYTLATSCKELTHWKRL